MTAIAHGAPGVKRRPLAFAALAGLLLAATAAKGAERQAVDLELVLLVDASGSIDEAETRLQRQGYAAAVTDPQVLRAVTGGLLRALAVAYVEFAAPGCVSRRAGWTRIGDAESAAAFAAAILAAPRTVCPGGNAIGEAVAAAAAELDANAFDGARKVIDVSGDGPNNRGPAVEPARDAAVAAGITINGLAIMRPGRHYSGPLGEPLDAYYRRAITGGPGSFVMVARGRETFAETILKKLVREIAAAPRPTGRLALH